MNVCVCLRALFGQCTCICYQHVNIHACMCVCVNVGKTKEKALLLLLWRLHKSQARFIRCFIAHCTAKQSLTLFNSIRIILDVYRLFVLIQFYSQLLCDLVWKQPLDEAERRRETEINERPHNSTARDGMSNKPKMSGNSASEQATKPIYRYSI